MNALLSAAGRAFIRAFLASLAIFALGVLTAPNLDGMFLLGLAALAASVGAGIRAVQEFAPMLSFARWIRAPYSGWLDSFAQGFLGTALVTLPGLLDAPNMALERSAWVALLVGASTAGLRAIQGAGTQGEGPFAGYGLSEPQYVVELEVLPPTTVDAEAPVDMSVSDVRHEPPRMAGRGLPLTTNTND